MNAVIRVSQSIARLTGPSCCKAYVRAALDEAVTIFAERFGIVLPRRKRRSSVQTVPVTRTGAGKSNAPTTKTGRGCVVASIHLPVASC